MKYDEIMELIKSLAKSQGFYGRFLEAINEASKEQRQEFKNIVEKQNFNDAVDFILWIEG